jgi:hypothetical protein
MIRGFVFSLMQLVMTNLTGLSCLDLVVQLEIETQRTILFRFGGPAGNRNAKISALRKTNSSGAELAFYTRTPGDAVNNDGGLERMRIGSNGNVGIGTTSPSSLLHIKSSGSANTNVTLENSTTSTQKLVAGLTGVNNSGFSIYDDLLSETTFRIASNGNVGIDTNAPGAKLEVNGIDQTTSALDTSKLTVLVRSSALLANSGGSLGFGATTKQWAGIKGLVINGDNNSIGDLSFSTRRVITDSTLTEAMRIRHNGNVGIGVSSPSYQLQLSTDSAGKPSTNTWTIVSDERIKEEIELADLDLCYEAVKNIPLKRFKWKDEVYTEEQAYDRRKLGWIAQDVEAVFPKAVRQHEFKYNQVFEEVVIPAVAEELDDDGNIVTEVKYSQSELKRVS